MKGVLVAILCLLLLVGAGMAYVFWPHGVPRDGSAQPTNSYSFDALGVSFLYPGTYAFESYPLEDEEGAWQEFVLIRKTDKIAAEQNGASEGPVSITIGIFPNTAGVGLEEWVRSTKHSNFHLSMDQKFSASQMGGQQSLSYRYTGLYEVDATAVVWKGQVYVISVGWVDSTDSIRADYATLLKTVSFK